MLLRKGRQCFIGPVFTPSDPPIYVIIVKRKWKVLFMMVFQVLSSMSKIFEVLEVCLLPLDSAAQCQIHQKLWTQKDFILQLDISHHNKNKERKEGNEEEIKKEGRKER